MKNIAFILLILAAVCFANCAGDYEAEPRGTNDGKAPAPITNISVKNVNGGAIIKYTPSDDVDLLYVKAIFTNTRGEQQEVRSDVYKRQVFNSRANINMSGGSETARYYVSLGISDDNGIMKVDKRNNYNSNI